MRRLRALCFVLVLIPLGGWEPLWQNDADVDAGNRAYAEGRYDDALAAYQRARDSGVDSAGLAYDEGTATMAKADQQADAAGRDALFEESWKQLGQATHAKDKALAARAHYNRGNIRMKQKKLDEAVDEYKDALRADPTLESARQNLELALRQREKQRQQQQQQGQGQGQGQQQQPQQGQGQGQQQQPQQGQGQGQPQQQPQQGQGQGQPQQQPPQGQGQGQPPQQPPGQQGQQGQQPPQGQGQPPRRMPQAQWPQDDTEGDTPDLPQGQKLDQLENMSRQLRRSRVRDGSDPSGAQPTQDW
ncbi:MAG: tetratricopeptide repeat protein [Myxococcales bacterium]|nr:tetratricopeptide repeat protein [Myxococcales bacterium]